MKPYNQALKRHSQDLRNHMTDAEQTLWQRLRRKQLHGVQFNRQKPLLQYIVDFYSAKARLVIEIDGSQHLESDGQRRDAERDQALARLGLRVLRFDNRQVLTETDSVVAAIHEVVGERLENPP